MQRGEIWWADLDLPHGSAPAKRRPVLVVQADSFNTSRIATVIAVVITANQQLAAAPGNVAISKRMSRLPRDSVVNVSQIVTLDKRALTDRISFLPADAMASIVAGMRLALDL
jgi:mRNA interferase MazF